MTVRRGILAAVLALGLSMGAPLSAFADPHEQSEPEQGTRLDSFPNRISVQFAQPVAEPALVSVATTDGDVVEEVEASVDGREIVADVAGIDEVGSFVVSYVVGTGDGGTIEGEIAFDVVELAVSPVGANGLASVDEEEEGTNWRGILSISIGVLLGVVVIFLSWKLLRGKPERDSLDEPLP